MRPPLFLAGNAGCRRSGPPDHAPCNGAMGSARTSWPCLVLTSANGVDSGYILFRAFSCLAAWPTWPLGVPQV